VKYSIFAVAQGLVSRMKQEGFGKISSLTQKSREVGFIRGTAEIENVIRGGSQPSVIKLVRKAALFPLLIPSPHFFSIAY
jgi:hypothetical protein